MLRQMIERSAVTDSFREAYYAWRNGEPQEALVVQGYAPPVKVERVLTKLLEAMPDLEIESVTIDGRSGCSNFTGHLVVQPGDVRIEFDWDCAWKARQAGYQMYGIPDQQRAAREFGYDCFRMFEEVD
ncbi:MAG: hypothetical protein HUU35_06195 [Armatimonadetes bacterium]|nr:hypothetical protein [Armatimonadota bacterium]